MIIAMYTHRVHVEKSHLGVYVLCCSAEGSMPGFRVAHMKDPARLRTVLVRHLQCPPYGAKTALQLARLYRAS